jgi:V8-like Glu-specific endopeptidase
MTLRIGVLSLRVFGTAMAAILAAACSSAAGNSGPAARAGNSGPATRATGCQKVQVLRYASARASGKPTSVTQCVPEAGLTTAVSASAPAGALAAVPGEIPTVGKLTFSADGILGLNCTATVIDGTPAANSEELILTAAHCIEGTIGRIAYTSTNLVFSPMWHNNKNPFGTWTVKRVFLNSGWLTCAIPIIDCKTNPLYDYAVIVLNPKNGKGVGDVTGADGWSANQPRTIAGVTIAGIPATSPGTLVTTAHTVTVTESGEPYRQASTPGFTDGSSGGPWLRDFSTKTGRGVLIGDTGGFEQGGPSSGSPSYSDYWTNSFAAVVKAAVGFEG